MKKFFKFALVALAAAAVVVSCNKPAAPQEEQKPADEQTVDPALVGTWSITGEAQEWKADAGVAMTESNNVWTANEVAIKGEGFKFVKDGSWDINLGAVNTKATQEFDDDEEISLAEGGDNIAGKKDGVYKVTLNLLTKKATIKFVKDLEPEFVPAINIDGDFSDWAEIEAVSFGTHKEFKVTLDDKYLYLYTKRVKGEGDAAQGYEEMWGNSDEGYVYVALDLDKNAETGEMLWTNGPYEFVGYSWPFGGSASSPAITEKPGASNTNCVPSTSTMKNILCKGVIGTDEVTIEYSIPRADLPAIPETPFIVYSWGSLGLDKAEYHVGEPQPSLFESHFGINWLNVDSVEGETGEDMDAVKSIRATADKEKVYVCVEVAKDALIWDKHTYADRSYFCFSDGTEGGSRWTQTESQKIEGWLMYEAAPYYINWNDAVVDHKAYTAQVEDVVYFEVAVLRSKVEDLQGTTGYVGFYMTDTYNDGSTSGSRAEIGYAPAKEESMLEITLPAM